MENKYKINKSYYLEVENNNFILVKKSKRKTGKNKGEFGFSNIAFFPPTQYGLKLLYSKFLSISLCGNKATDLKELQEEMCRLDNDFKKFIVSFNEKKAVKDLPEYDGNEKEPEINIYKKKKRRKLKRK